MFITVLGSDLSRHTLRRRLDGQTPFGRGRLLRRRCEVQVRRLNFVVPDRHVNPLHNARDLLLSGRVGLLLKSGDLLLDLGVGLGHR